MNGVISSRDGMLEISSGALSEVHEPIALVGIGCRFPGASGPEEFWQLLKDGIDATSEMPERPDPDTLYDASSGIPQKSWRRRGGFLKDIEAFDAAFFGISPREARSMDPQQRLLLEVAWESLEDAGLVPEEIGRQTGVFLGMWINDYDDLLALEPEKLDLYAVTGGSRFSAPGRVSYCFGFEGPSLLVDTACSSSLVAVHLACQSLRQGECTVALAGGANLVLQPQGTLGFGQANLLAGDGRCKFGDRRADGFSRSEGVGVVVLKRLSRAVDDGDDIYAVIRGSAVNHNGQTSGQMVTPGTVTQEEVLRQACRAAGIEPAKLSYVEAHGTGTPVGDPTELGALGTVVTEGGRSQEQPCLVGSVKTNIGHTEGASGVAGLIKIALSLKHQQIPPNLFPQEPNPAIPWQELPLEIVRELRPWPRVEGPKRAGLNSFGLAGTNAHIIAEEAPTAAAAEAAPEPGPHLLPLSARHPQALKSQAKGLVELLANNGEPTLQAVCSTAGLHRQHHDHRLAVVAQDRQELQERLAAFVDGTQGMGTTNGAADPERSPRVVFVFPGQGSQWLGMGRELLAREEVFRQQLEACDAVIARFADFSLLDELAASEEASQLARIDVVQPTLWAVQVSLAALWRSWGIEPAAVVGQSMGEVAAACVAGSLSLVDAACVICRRSRLLRRVSGQGEMAMVELSFDETERALQGYEDRLSIAVSSSFSSTVVAGDPAALGELLEVLQEKDVFCRRIQVDVASHSPQMDPLREDLLAALADVKPRAAEIPIYSTVESRRTDGEGFDAAYWVKNLRQPVRFSAAIEQLSDDDFDVYLEVSPHPVLLPAVERNLAHLRRKGVVLPSLRRNEPERATLLGSLGSLYCRGQHVDWRGLHPGGGSRIRLPSYPWQRQRFWLRDPDEPSRPSTWRGRGRLGSGHPLLEASWTSSVDLGKRFWETEVGVGLLPYLADHRVRGTAVVPAAVYLEMVLASAKEILGDGPFVVEDVSFEEALFLNDDANVRLQLVTETNLGGPTSFQILSRPAALEAGGVEAGEWTRHVRGTFRRVEMAAEAAGSLPQDVLKNGGKSAVSAPELYQSLAARSLGYGPAFQGVAEAWHEKGEALGRLHRTPPVQAQAASYQLHPALLDACLQVSLAALDDGDSTISYLPVHLRRLQWLTPPGDADELWSHALLEPGQNGHAVGDVALSDAQGRKVLQIEGLGLQQLLGGREDLDDWFFHVDWQEEPRPAAEALPAGRWLLFADRGGVAQALGARLTAEGHTCVTVGTLEADTSSVDHRIDPSRPEELTRLFDALLTTGEMPLLGVAHLWGLDLPVVEKDAANVGAAAEPEVLLSVLHLVQELVGEGGGRPRSETPRLWLVTAGCQPQTDETAALSLAQAPLWGLGGVVAHEHPALRCARVDLSAAPGDDEIEALAAELSSGSPEEGGSEEQVALREQRRYVARLARWKPADDSQSRVSTVAGELPYHLEMTRPGVLDDLTLRAAPRPLPAAGEVEIEVLAAGLNFHDIMLAMGLLSTGAPDGPLVPGVECAGRISAVGEGVEGLAVGDEILAFARGAISRYALTDARLVAPKPAELSFEQAAGVAAVFVTAVYALDHLGRLRRGERVLLHTASGGVGLAAIQIARARGAEIFATAGSPEKRELLKSLGVEHVMDSRSLDFADQVKQWTAGEGVDVVLNTLTGEAVRKNLEILAPYGRFVEIGKRDLLENRPLELRPFLKSLSYSTVDVKAMSQERPSLFAEILADVSRSFSDGTFTALPSQVYAVSQAAEAFRFMAQARHTGKIVLSFSDPEVRLERSGNEPFEADGTYLVTGGLGGLGLEFARFLVERGARHLVLVGRRGARPEAASRLQALEEAGAEVLVARADVSQRDEVEALLTQVRREMPPLRGVFHAAGLLDDAPLLQLDGERLRKVFAPKVDGAWNLHVLTLTDPLDCFVLFSSVATLLGIQGQGNYAAANAFLDALARRRRDWGLPATSIAWGPWAEVGLAAAQENRGNRLAGRGLGSFVPERGLAAFERLRETDPAWVAVMPFDADRWSQDPAVGSSSFLACLATSAGTSPQEQREADHSQDLAGRLRQEIGQVLRIQPAEIDPQKPLRSLGLDSLMALELRNRLEVSFGLTLSATVVWNHPSTAALAAYLSDELGISADDVEAEVASESIETLPSGSAPLPNGLVPDEIEQMSDEEVMAALRGEA